MGAAAWLGGDCDGDDVDVLARVPDDVWRVLEMTGLDHLFGDHDRGTTRATPT